MVGFVLQSSVPCALGFPMFLAVFVRRFNLAAGRLAGSVSEPLGLLVALFVQRPTLTLWHIAGIVPYIRIDMLKSAVSCKSNTALLTNLNLFDLRCLYVNIQFKKVNLIYKK